MILFDSRDYIYTETKCEDCNGVGAVYPFWSTTHWEYCSSCKGKGVFVEKREMTRFDIMDFDE